MSLVAYEAIIAERRNSLVLVYVSKELKQDTCYCSWPEARILVDQGLESAIGREKLALPPQALHPYITWRADLLVDHDDVME